MKKLVHSALLAAVCIWAPGCGGDGCCCAHDGEEHSCCCCCGHEPAAVPDLESGGVWTLSAASLHKLAGTGEMPAQPVTIQFTEGGTHFSGCAGVNRYFGGAQVDAVEHRIKFGPAASTRMAGPGLEFERAFLKALASADGFEIENGKLRLTGGGNVLAEFETGKENKQL